ncbi:MAG: hypothetical protein LBN07_01035 [Christensenellaceae bacterium]|jgi:hypothetical protein|nr:hypothetical protein [Christensenellaceae bacterium]
MNWFEETWNTLTNFLRGIDPLTRYIIIAALAIVVCMCLIKFIKKNTNKTSIMWIYAVLALLCIGVIILLSVFA